MTCLSLEDLLYALLEVKDSRLVELLLQEALVTCPSWQDRESWLSLVALQLSWKFS